MNAAREFLCWGLCHKSLLRFFCSFVLLWVLRRLRCCSEVTASATCRGAATASLLFSWWRMRFRVQALSKLDSKAIARPPKLAAACTWPLALGNGCKQVALAKANAIRISSSHRWCYLCLAGWTLPYYCLWSGCCCAAPRTIG